MDFDSFRQSIPQSAPPNGLRAEVEALWRDAKGDWDRAHALIQDLSSLDAAWVHAYLHRKEGDNSNAGYWYRRAGRPPFMGTLEAEWEYISRGLLE